MSEPTLIGLLHLRPMRHPHWSDEFDRDPSENSWGVPREVLLPELFVGGLPFQAFAAAMLTREAMLCPVEHTLGNEPRPEGGWFRLERERFGEVTLTCCDCGESGCGSTQVTATPGTLGGVNGTFLSGWFTQGNPDARMNLPRVFIPAAAWPDLTDAERHAAHGWPGGRLGQLLQEGDAPGDAAVRQAAQARWHAAKSGMLRAARQAAQALPDPWGRELELKCWRQRSEAAHRAMMAEYHAEHAARRTPECLRAAYEERLRTLQIDEDHARAGVLSVGGFASLLQDDTPATAEQIAALLAAVTMQREQAAAQFEWDLRLAQLSARDRRVARRAARREEASQPSDPRALLRTLGFARRRPTARRPA